MKSSAKTVDEYMAGLPDERKEALVNLRKCILDNLPEGFTEEMDYGKPSYVMPKMIYPVGNHCDPKHLFPFMGFALQKNNISFYHMGLYSDKELCDRFIDTITRQNGKKPDIGKSRIRFRKSGEVPYELSENSLPK